MEWISVKDRLPKLLHEVLTVVIDDDGRRFIIQCLNNKGEWINPFNDRFTQNVSHWMPLPEQPKITLDKIPKDFTNVPFHQVKDLILEKTKEFRKLNMVLYDEEEDWTLFDGFINPNYYPQLPGKTILGGPTIPMIMFVGDLTGRIHLFALKRFLKDT